ncbi:MAG TPA: xanthine dehydrogenase family protein molybdopterin-binding subunit, partial [Haliangium sp.]|nr:xanthine dehydrogenase family protein molybdopterin-binding subunit [Haliangium sp.]
MNDDKHGAAPGPIGDVVGASVPRVEAHEKISGRAVYTDDMTVPGMLHAAMLGSPHAHARILSYDTSQARALPGVRAVLTAEDLPDRPLGPILKDMPILARGKVRYVGEPVVAVAAVDLPTARAALGLIQIEYEPLPAVFDTEAALQSGAPLIHDGFPGNVSYRVEIIEGDAEGAWDDCDVIVEGVYETPAQAHMYMEPCTTLAIPEPNGRLTIWTSTQTVFRVQAITAEALAVPMTKIRVLAARVGGGFGGKTESTNQPITAALARAAGAPVRMTLSRADDTTMMKSRHPCRIYMRTGAKQNGKLRAREVRLHYDTGSYADDGPSVITVGAYFSRGPYRIPYHSVDSVAVYTNKLRASAFRGFGNPQITFASEVQIDELAERLGMDPIELRLKNAIDTGERWLGGARVESGTLDECLKRVRTESNWAVRRQQSAPTPGKRRGVGMAAIPHVCALLGTSADARLNEDGTLTVNTAGIDTGTGSATVLAQCAAGVLGLSLDQINHAGPDSDTSPYDFGTLGSRTTFMLGKAVTEACERVKEQIFHHAAEILECSQKDLELRPGGVVGIKGVPDATTTFAAVVGRALYFEGGPIWGTYKTLQPTFVFDPKRVTTRGIGSVVYGMLVFAAQVAEVEVDELTGKVEVLHVWSTHDVGRVINPSACEGQVYGGVVQGLGYALHEEMRWDGDGRLVNPTMLDYKIPAAPDVRLEIHPTLLEFPVADGPFGAKGVAEVLLV